MYTGFWDANKESLCSLRTSRGYGLYCPTISSFWIYVWNNLWFFQSVGKKFRCKFPFCGKILQQHISSGLLKQQILFY